MKNLIAILCFILFTSCGYNFKFTPLPHLDNSGNPEILQIKQQLEDIRISTGYIENGVNMMYQYGYYIYALHVNNILLPENVQDFCNQADILKFEAPRGMISHPAAGLNRVMSRDDYFGTLLGAVTGCAVNKCACDLVEWMYNSGKPLQLVHDAWNPVFMNIFERAYKRQSHAYFYSWDLVNYSAASEKICATANSNTSNKLLHMAELIIVQDSAPSGWSNGSYNYCKEQNDFNTILNIYYGDKPLGKLLQNTL